MKRVLVASDARRCRRAFQGPCLDWLDPRLVWLMTWQSEFFAADPAVRKPASLFGGRVEVEIHDPYAGFGLPVSNSADPARRLGSEGRLAPASDRWEVAPHAHPGVSRGAGTLAPDASGGAARS